MNDWNNFTFEVDNEKFFKGVIDFLKSKQKNAIVETIQNGYCTVSQNVQWGKRYGAAGVDIIFYVSFEFFEKAEKINKKELFDACKFIMPLNAGFDIIKVEIAPDINSNQIKPTLIDIAEKISKEISQTIPIFALSDEIIIKGKEMSECYIFLYLVENTMRVFIEQISKEEFGENFWENLMISTEIKKGIQIKRNQEQKNQYLTLRGDNELYYCDFKELGLLITNNWDLFKNFFPSFGWIQTKMDEMGNCRNLIAHNSYIDQHNRDLIKVNYESILKQIKNGFEN